MNKWKKLGNVTSADDKSFGSQRSRQKTSFESFRRSLDKKSESLTPQKNKSFCFEYLKNRKVNKRKQARNFDLTDPENKNDLKSKQDLFTSMRNVIKGSATESKIVSKDNVAQEGKKKSVKKPSNRVRQTLDIVQKLKKQQKKLKKQLQQEFEGFKNMFYQIDEVSYMHSNTHNKPQKLQEGTLETQFLKQMILEGMDAERFFAEMERKKEQVLRQLDI